MRSTRAAFSHFRPPLFAAFRCLTEPRVRCNYATAWRRGSSTTSLADVPIQFCVVGSGPAGFYTCDQAGALAVGRKPPPTVRKFSSHLFACIARQILKKFPYAQVDLLDRLPTPFGLVRSGVAPDHPETKVRRWRRTTRETRSRLEQRRRHSRILCALKINRSLQRSI